ncbi:hypothetical protein Droror1_Dr00023327 [Drosera rotundifolia]
MGTNAFNHATYKSSTPKRVCEGPDPLLMVGKGVLADNIKWVGHEHADTSFNALEFTWRMRLIVRLRESKRSEMEEVRMSSPNMNGSDSRPDLEIKALSCLIDLGFRGERKRDGEFGLRISCGY